MSQQSYAEAARNEGRDYISLDSGMASHWICTHCKSWSPGEWGEGVEAVRHKAECPLSLCRERDCPSFGQPPSRACKCHPDYDA